MQLWRDQSTAYPSLLLLASHRPAALAATPPASTWMICRLSGSLRSMLAADAPCRRSCVSHLKPDLSAGLEVRFYTTFSERVSRRSVPSSTSCRRQRQASPSPATAPGTATPCSLRGVGTDLIATRWIAPVQARQFLHGSAFPSFLPNCAETKPDYLFVLPGSEAKSSSKFRSSHGRPLLTDPVARVHDRRLG